MTASRGLCWSRSRCPNAFLSLSLVIAFCAIAVGCGTFQTRTRSSLDQVPVGQSPILVMASPDISYGHTSAESYLRAHQVASALAAAGLPVVAPWEIELAPGSAWPHGAEQLARLMMSNGLDAGRVLLLELRIEQRGGMRAVMTPDDMGGEALSSFTPEVEIYLRVRDLTTRELFAEVSVEFEDDAFADGEALQDERPLIGDAIDVVALRLAEELNANLDSPVGSASSIVGVYNHRRIFEFAGGPTGPLADELAALDPIEAQVERFNWYRTLDPAVDAAAAARFDALPPGLRVTAVSGPAAVAGLRAGDYVTAINTHPAVGPQAVERVFLTTPTGESIRLAINRGGQELEVRVVP